MNLLGTMYPCGFVLAIGAFLSLYSTTEALIKEIPLPAPLRDCYTKARNYSTESYVGSLYCWYCESPIRTQLNGAPSPPNAQQSSYFQHLYGRLAEPNLYLAKRRRRQATSRCVRREYRTLSDDERIKFHNAINTLKRDTSVQPNKYDALALFHTGSAVFVAHAGPGFFGWHRIFLLMFEAALQEVDSTICLPYWDSTIDNSLPNPTQSYIFSTKFFGGGDGEVTNGPFAGWQTPEGTALMRSVGRDGQLFTRQIIEDIMSRSTHEEIALPGIDPQYDLEFHHGGPHVFIGGDMERLNTAAFDPVFFMHHAYVDYIWELFRQKMRNNGFNPERYPLNSEVNDFHQPTAPMGFGNVTHAEGYLDALTDSYTYALSPECSARNPNCGSKYLACDVARARCIPIEPPVLDYVTTTIPPYTTLGVVTTTHAPIPPPLPHVCTKPRPLAYQNNFCINKVCDINKWVWIPVKIVAHRPPEFKQYMSYPVQNGMIIRRNDIYEPSVNTDTNRYIASTGGKPKGFDKCDVADGIGKIFVTSQGVDYEGKYKESSIIDQRLATSISVTYVAVKDPGTSGVTQAILRAHDSCGRICHTSCKVPNTNPPRYEACSGVVEVTSQLPKQYGSSYQQALLGVYDYTTNSDCPVFTLDDVFLTFYCDYRDYLPWVGKSTMPSPTPSPRPPLVTYPGGAQQCAISAQCTINLPCQHTTNSRKCSKYMEMHACVGNCSQYAICMYGIYWPRFCPSGSYFNAQLGRCVKGKCPAGMQSTYGVRYGTRGYPMNTFVPTPNRVHATSYYDRLINNFSFQG